MNEDILTGDAASREASGAHELEDASGEALPERTAATPSAAGIEAREVALVAARAGDDKKADDVRVLDLTELSDVCDFFVIMSASNARLVDAVVDEVEERVAKTCGEHPFSIEGRDQRTWILMDYGSVIVHVFTPEARDYYRLETLWGDAPQVPIA